MAAALALPPYRVGLWLLAASAAAFGGALTLPAGAAPAAAVSGIVLLAGAAQHLRSRLLFGATVAATLATAAAALPLDGMSYRAALRAEIVLALLPLVALGLARAGGHAARSAARVARRVPLSVAGVAIAVVGTLVRLGEIALLWDQPGSLATLRYALRGDLAGTFWALALLANAGAHAYAAHAASARPNRGVRRAVAAAALFLLVFSFVGYDVATAAAAAAHGPVSVEVGLHVLDVRDLPAGSRLAHLDVAWDRVERTHGERNWTRFDEQVRAAEARGIGLYLLANTYPPAWLARERPQSVMVDQDREPFLWVDERPGAARERVWDLSFHDEQVIELKHDFARAVTARYAASPAVRWIAVQNEPAYPVDWNLVRYASYDNFTIRAFQIDLSERYPSLESLNENATAEWESWGEVEAPRHPFSPLWADWMRFREDALVEFTQGLVDAVRPFAAAKPVTVKIMAHAGTQFAEPQAGLSDRVVRAMANMSDTVSVDLYPASIQSLRRSLDYWTEVAAGKPLVLAEFNLLLGTNIPTGGARLVNALLAMDQRVEAVFIFTSDDHWLYGLTAHARSPGLTALTLATTSPLSPTYGMTLSALLVEDLLSLQNTYHIYSLGMTAAGLPVLPWPVLLLVSAPAPTVEGRARIGLLAAKAALVIVMLALLLI